MHEKKEKARQMRRAGMSIKAIELELNISRSTASRWCREIKLSRRQIAKLYRNQRTGALTGSYVAAENKKKQKQKRIEAIAEEATVQFGRRSSRDRFIAGVALYAGEGSKTGNTVQFANSNPALVATMMEWFRKDCGVAESRFRGWVYIHDDLDEERAKQFWSKLTGIPVGQFTKSYIAENKTGRFRKRLHEYGVFRVSVADFALLCRIKTWIALLTSKDSGVAQW
jgi:hypothetical protein